MTTTTKRRHRTGAGSAINPDHIGMHRLIVVGVIATLAAAIADPFAGSAATLIAARNLGRRSIGVEMDPAYAAAAVRRIESSPLRLFPADAEVRSSGWSGTEQPMFDLAAGDAA